MGLIEIQHVVADNFDVDPDWAGTPETIEGLLVTLNSSGYALPVSDTANERKLGVAGDTQSNSNAGTPYSDSLVINSGGAVRKTQNRVSDFYNETLSSGKMTVYHSGGTFATDQYESNVTAANPGDALYCSNNGKLSTAVAGGIVATAVKAVGALDSGVPGVDTPNGSISLGNYVTFKLEI